jgi:hypothetical protein
MHWKHKARVEAGYSTSTVLLRVVEGDKKGMSEGISGTQVTGEMNTGTWAFRLEVRRKADDLKNICP